MRPPQRQPAAGADTVRAVQEFTVTAETASPQVDPHKDRQSQGTHVCARVHKHSQVQTLAVNPAKVQLLVTLVLQF